MFGQGKQHICGLINGKNYLSRVFCCLCIVLWFQLYHCGAQTTTSGNLSVEQYLSFSVEKEKAGDIAEAARLLGEAANKYREAKDYRLAIQHYNRSIEMYRSLGNESSVIGIQNYLGVVYYELGEYDNSLRCFREVYQYQIAHGDKATALTSLLNITAVLDRTRLYDMAIRTLNEAVTIADELNYQVLKRSCYGLLAEIYNKNGNTVLSDDFTNQRRRLHEILIQPEHRKLYLAELDQTNKQVLLATVKQRYADLELLFKQQEIAEKNQALKNLDSINKALLLSKSKSEKLIGDLKTSEELAEEMRKQTEKQLKTEQLKNYFLYFGLGFVLVIAVIITLNYIQKRYVNKKLANQNAKIIAQRNKILEQKQALENAYNEIRQKNDDITKSIDYAEYIQKAFLTTPEELLSRLPDSFIYMKPCAIVSGDFLWCKRVGSKFLVACVDCTGHGVPGAFMSLIGSNLLSQIVDQGLVSPEQVLNVLNIALYHALHKHESKLHSGMDMAMYCIDYERKELVFSGAKLPLLYVQNDKMTKIQGDINSIGGHYLQIEEDLDIVFRKHVVPLDVPTWVYLSSDGYQSQFSYADKKKFQSKRFQNLLFKIHQKPMPRQREILRKTMDKWLRIGEQVDDILIIGTKIDLTEKTETTS